MVYETHEAYNCCCDDEQSGSHRELTTCPECNGQLRTEAGETACEDCGLIIHEYRYNHGATPRSYAGSERRREQVGASRTPIRHDYGLSTKIGRGRDGRDNRLSNRKRRQLKRLRREHGRGRFNSQADRNLAHALTEIMRLTAALELGQFIGERASKLYREAQSADLITGRTTEGMAAASVYTVCRMSGHACPLPDLAQVAHLAQSQLLHRYLVVKRELDLPVPPTRLDEVLPRIASECALTEQQLMRAVEYLRWLKEAELTINRKPAGVAAACVYVAAAEGDESVTKQEVAAVADVSIVTLSKRIDELRCLL